MTARNLSTLVGSSVDLDFFGRATDFVEILAADFAQDLLRADHTAVDLSTLRAGFAPVKAAFEDQGFTVDRVIRSASLTVATLSSSDAAAIVRSTPRSSDLAVSARTHTDAEAVARAIARSARPAAGTPDVLDLTLWYAGRHGYEWVPRRIEAPAWASIRRNYPVAVREALDALHAVERPTGRGSLVLVHGAPGTGKTTAIRSMIRSWSPWSTTHYVTDPERLFGDAGYLWEVVADSGHDDQVDGRWQIVVAEDSDEFLRSSARQEAGAAMGRLLNFTDGMMGQGSNTIVVITTNERLDRLHPAVTRPGRCLAQIEFAPFGPDEAASWLGSGTTTPSAPMTLAELFAQQNGVATISGEPIVDAPFGTYL